jgi:CRP-like cAMP-binding protein
LRDETVCATLRRIGGRRRLSAREMTGSARETVSRALERLEAAGVVVRQGRSYRLQVNPETIATR